MKKEFRFCLASGLKHVPRGKNSRGLILSSYYKIYPFCGLGSVARDSWSLIKNFTSLINLVQYAMSKQVVTMLWTKSFGFYIIDSNNNIYIIYIIIHDVNNILYFALLIVSFQSFKWASVKYLKDRMMNENLHFVVTGHWTLDTGHWTLDTGHVWTTFRERWMVTKASEVKTTLC